MTRFAVSARRDERIPTTDPDVTLSADVFLPAGADPAPALLTVLPYRKDTGIAEPALRWFAERGYASVLVDMRGIGSSDGAVRPPFDPSESDDAVAAIEWTSAQPWCDGNVGMWGHSYGAMMSLRAAVRRPAALKAIAPFQCVLDPERDLWHLGGGHGGINLAAWGAMTLVQHLLPSLRDPESDDERRRWQGRLDAPEPFAVDLFRHGPDDPIWRERVIDPSTITIPTLVGAGWRDLMCNATLRAFEQINGPKRLVVGPWTHVLPDLSSIEPVGFLETVRRWFDHWLRGTENGVTDEPPVVAYVEGEKRAWRGYDSWPPSDEATPFSFGGGKYRSDPTIGTLSGMWWLGHPGIPLDQHDDDMRGLSVDAGVLRAGLLIAGRPGVTVQVTGPLPSRLVVRLADVDGRGRSTFITSGVARPGDGPTHVECWPTAYRLAAGHRLRVVVCDADFPRVWPGADAAEFDVASIEVTIPCVRDDAGVTVELPAVEPPAADGDPLWLWGDRSWKIARDPLRNGVEVAVGEQGAVRTPNREHVIELHQTLRASAGPAVCVEAANAAVARLASGEVVEVEVSVRLTGAGLSVGAEVTVDGAGICKRTWEETLR